MPNKLQKETSPYLLQHQNNPVDWHPWHPETLNKAQAENKLMLVSIGYAACHWCHVMERESFEDQGLADLLNAHFISIKVDREERPDIDQLYMLALQLITGQGGWPLNMICLPDGRPVYGGTYFRKDDFIAILTQLQDKWDHQPREIMEYAERLTRGVQQAENLSLQTENTLLSKQELHQLIGSWSQDFDTRDGGFMRVPKFPLPGSWQFLLAYGQRHQMEAVTQQVHLTLEKMGSGGIYDQIGGGFCRYSVDGQWKVPHFEKMLYDNALLLTLYSEAYSHKANHLYKSILEDTINWLLRKMKAPGGGFYSALDADSEGVEGKYYTFSYTDFEAALGQSDARKFADYFQVSEEGNWTEEHTNVLQARPALAISGLEACKSRLLAFRQQRIRPGLDNKVICSWNAMLVSGLCSAYAALGEQSYLKEAKVLLDFIQTTLQEDTGAVLRLNPKGGRKVPGFLDDYAFLIKALVDYYQVSFEQTAIESAYRLSRYVIEAFYEEEAGAFYYTAKGAEELIARKAELMDDVIPSSNSVMIQQLDKLGVIFEDASFEHMARSIAQNMIKQIQQYPGVFPGWLMYLDQQVNGRYEIALCGPQYQDMHRELLPSYIPGKLLMGGSVSNLPFLQGKIQDRNQAYLCQNKTCSVPVSSVGELLNLIFKPEQENVPKN